MRNEQEERFVFYRFCISDMSECCKTLLLLGENEDEAVRFALIKSAIIAYSRPFSGNEPVFRKKTKWKLPDDLVPEDMLEVHEKALEYRNKFVAHTDLSYRKPELLQARQRYAIGHNAPGYSEINEFSDRLETVARALLGILWGEARELEARLV